MNGGGGGGERGGGGRGVRAVSSQSGIPTGHLNFFLLSLFLSPSLSLTLYSQQLYRGAERDSEGGKQPTSLRLAVVRLDGALICTLPSCLLVVVSHLRRLNKQRLFLISFVFSSPSVFHYHINIFFLFPL